MSILDRILSRSATATSEGPTTPTAEPPATPTIETPTAPTAGTSPLPGVDEERLIEIAQRIVPPTDTPTHFFVCSGNRSLIEAYHSLFRMAAPAYGGSATVYRADTETLSARQADAAGDSMPFEGQRSLGAKPEPAPDLAGVLGSMSRESPSGRVFIAYVTVGPQGIGWVRETYATVMNDAMSQGILPFWMYETTSADAARYLLDSFTEA